MQESSTLFLVFFFVCLFFFFFGFFLISWDDSEEILRLLAVHDYFHGLEKLLDGDDFFSKLHLLCVCANRAAANLACSCLLNRFFWLQVLGTESTCQIWIKISCKEINNLPDMIVCFGSIAVEVEPIRHQRALFREILWVERKQEQWIIQLNVDATYNALKMMQKGCNKSLSALLPNILRCFASGLAYLEQKFIRHFHRIIKKRSYNWNWLLSPSFAFDGAID